MLSFDVDRASLPISLPNMLVGLEIRLLQCIEWDVKPYVPLLNYHQPNKQFTCVVPVCSLLCLCVTGTMYFAVSDVM